MYLSVKERELCVLFCHFGSSGVHDRFSIFTIPLFEIAFGFFHAFDVFLFGLFFWFRERTFR